MINMTKDNIEFGVESYVYEKEKSQTIAYGLEIIYARYIYIYIKQRRLQRENCYSQR